MRNRSATVGAVHQVILARIRIRGCSVPRRSWRQEAVRAACRACFQTSGVRTWRIEPESDSARQACRRALLADVRADGVEHDAAMGSSLW